MKKDIEKTLNTICVQCDRKTVGRNINYLIEFGCAIIKSKNGVCYLLNNDNYKPMLKDVNF